MTTVEAIRTAGSNSVPGRSMPIARILLLEALLAGAAGAYYVGTFWLAGTLLALSIAIAVFGFRRREGISWAQRRALTKKFAAAAAVAAPAPPAPAAPVAPQSDVVLVALKAIAPALRLTDATHRGRTIGVAEDGAGWFAAVDLAPGRGLDGNRHTQVSVAHLAELLVAEHLPVTAIQVVATSVPAPAPGAETGSPCRRSYLSLIADRPIVADHSLRIVARLSGGDAAAASAARGGGLKGVQRALAATLGNVVATVSAPDCVVETLDAAQLGAALLDSLYPAGFDPRQQTTVDEQWQAWHGKSLVHRTWRLKGWPRIPLSELHDRLVYTGIQTVVTSLTLRKDPYGTQPTADLLVRLVMPLSELAAGDDRLTLALRAVNLSAEPVDGRQAAAAYASAPTAGSI
ncbi:type VII secretion protein EccE [Rhizocola hellebori]|uniref:Type VII secretion protein EccE n=1 Tax=Rhizocola hellebori TaxID=1392758 RepID=A0A8J3QJ05_9ACTN|nr:type VII secretion protein EccE [Rhizocola hellebori]GIH10639.1 type VII secretion protein EccE [Rhizocola hellebori]